MNNLLRRIKILEEFYREEAPLVFAFAIIESQWVSGVDRDRDFTGIDFEPYIGFEKYPELKEAQDLQELKILAQAKGFKLIVMPVCSLEDVWADERQEENSRGNGRNEEEAWI